MHLSHTFPIDQFISYHYLNTLKYKTDWIIIYFYFQATSQVSGVFIFIIHKNKKLNSTPNDNYQDWLFKQNQYRLLFDMRQSFFGMTFQNSVCEKRIQTSTTTVRAARSSSIHIYDSSINLK